MALSPLSVGMGMSAIEPSRVDRFTVGVSREWYCEDRIVVYTVRHATPESLDVWGKVATQTGVNWPHNQLYLGLHDFSQTQVPLSPKAYSLALRMAQRTTHLHGYFGGVVQRGGVITIVESLLRINILPLTPRLQMRIFFTRAAGLSWLMTKAMDDHNKKPPEQISGGF
jgi:hypothetical protein